MKTIFREKGGITIIELSGHVGFEDTEHFKRKIYPLLKQKKRRYVFNCENLQFVGSSHMRNFLMTLNSLVDGNAKPKYCSLPKEFARLLEVLVEDEFELFESEDLARRSFRLERRGRRSLTH